MSFVIFFSDPAVPVEKISQALQCAVGECCAEYLITLQLENHQMITFL